MTQEAMSDILDVLCPMHLMLDGTGHIVHAGPTLQKLRPQGTMKGQRFLELFELVRPRAISSMHDLIQIVGTKLHLHLRDAPQTGLKGIIVPAPDGEGGIVNLSFGISILDALRDYDLTNTDFAPTDPTVEMLYLVEAKSLAMQAFRTLSQRLHGAKIAAEEQAYSDTLTGLKNRRAMDHILNRLLDLGEPFALMHLDLDYFKSINDTLGHAAGDHVLRIVASIMIEETREQDTVARVGGDEFVLIFKNLLDREKLLKIARRLIERLEVPIPFDGNLCRISCSIGTVLSSDYRATDAASLLDDADVALYASKHAGRACHTYYAPELREMPPPGPPTAGRGAARGDA
ncbi:GGDEF domain-containing protein [Thalassococcus sp. S3]|uniref:GGDEF domain-containing protein n=1 Tax=Thalassococcus sp. S3 TaxID=2017482 RepID=UPI0010242852|nr:GGDEF domain-containing protein [Thalassococcus sp. S3]QBF31173.1 GGDEF domain-containing protein [Thalassococcus sp. S3]